MSRHASPCAQPNIAAKDTSEDSHANLARKLDKMFSPRSIAMVGASDVPIKWGSMVLSSILGGGYKGEVYPVNPKKDIILGRKVYRSLSDIPGQVDLAVFTIPAKYVPDGLRECVALGIEAAIIISSGFKETGNEGATLEQELVEIATQGGLVFIGPNTMGIASAHDNMEIVMALSGAKAGGLAMISQSGNMGLQIMKWIADKQLGLSFYAGTGNAAMLKASDLLRYFGNHDKVKAISMYIEGIEDGRAFMQAATEITRHKPVIALKTGRSKTGSQAAQSHTGSMAGSYATCKAMFKQTGVTLVRTPTELMNVSAAMTHLPIPKSNRVGIMTLGGGWGVVAADECEDAGLVLPTLSPAIIQDLDQHLPDFWNRANPIDVVGERNPELYIHVIEALSKWDEVDAVIALGVLGTARFIQDFISSRDKMSADIFNWELKDAIHKMSVQEEARIISNIARIQQETGKPVLVVSSRNTEGLVCHKTDQGGVISMSSPEEACTILAYMVQYGNYLRKFSA